MPAVNIDAPAMAMPIAAPLFTLAAGALLSGGVFPVHISMTPGQVTAAGADTPPDDDLGDDDAIYSQDGP